MLSRMHRTAHLLYLRQELFLQIARPEDLATLKEQLKQALSDIETKERDIHEDMRPKTLREAEDSKRSWLRRWPRLKYKKEASERGSR